MKPTKTETQREYHQRILRVLVHIQSHLDHALDLDELARVAAFSRFHFHRIFRGMVGESVAEHVRRLRLERAAQQLKTGDLPVTQVAFNAGYETHEAFTRAFGAMFEQSPSAFRKEHRKIPVRPVASGVHYAADSTLSEFQSPLGSEVAVDVRVETAEPKRVAFMRHVGPYDQVGPLWERFFIFAMRSGLIGPGFQMLGVPHDDPGVTPPEKLRYDACITVGPQFQALDEVGVQEIPGGAYAVTTHHGPYSGLNEVYDVLIGQWLPASGHQPGEGAAFEIYRNSPKDTAPADLITDIYVPLRSD
jgi:AraC family transcriptional regulator